MARQISEKLNSFQKRDGILMKEYKIALKFVGKVVVFFFPGGSIYGFMIPV